MRRSVGGTNPVLVRLAIDPDALALEGSAPHLVRAAHERFVEIWDRFGIMVPHPKDNRELRERIDELPQALRTIWKTAFGRAAKNGLRCASLPSGTTPGGIASCAELVRLGGLIDILCVDEVRAAVLDVPEGEVSREDAQLGLEIAHFGGLDRSRRVLAAKCLAEARIVAGTPVSHLWRERFGELMLNSKRLVIVDRYAWASHRGRRDHLSGLKQLLDFADASAGGIRVALFSACDEGEDEDVERQLRTIFEGLKGGGVPEFRLHLSNDVEFRKISHGRHMRFDSSVVTLDVGLEIFSGRTVQRDVQFALRPASDADEAIERGLRTQSRPSMLLARGG